MPAQKKTTLGLNQWIGSEYPKRIDFVEDNKIINDELENRVKYTDLAEENKAGIITYAKIKEIAPKPDLSPYIPFSKGYRNNSSSDFVLRANGNEAWIPLHAHMYNNTGDYVGTFHLNGSKAYFKVPNRNGGNWCEIMDNYDMATRDQRMDSISTNLNSVWHILNNDTVRDIRMVGQIAPIVAHANQATERAGYVVTGLANGNSDHIIDQVQMRAVQIRRGGNGNNWYNVPFG